REFLSSRLSFLLLLSRRSSGRNENLGSQAPSPFRRRRAVLTGQGPKSNVLMCGIAGILDLSGTRPVDESLLRKMNDTLFHRGRDDEGYRVDGPVGLAMRRLSIIDLDAGHQPVHNEDKTVSVVFNGEIYNYQELTAVLRAKQHLFSTASDTETIVHLYEEHGDACVEHLRGMFAFALW